MAEFALGLTKTAVEGTVSRVKLAIDEETKLRVRVQNDLVFITGEFQMMQSFLNVANKERAKNEVVRTWVRQIRDLAFDVEDCVELVVSLDIKSGWSWLWRVLPGCMAPPRPLDQAVAEIQRLKARVEDVSHRNTRYNLISDSGSDSNSSKHALITNVSSMAPELIPANDIASAPSSTFQLLHEVWEAAGKMRRDKGDLRKLLFSGTEDITNEDSDLEVISLWGSPGPAADLGTMSILRTAYNDPKICQDFKIRAWIKLMHPFNPDKFLKRLLTQLCASSHRANILGPEFQADMRAAVSGEDDLMKAGQLVQQVCDEHRYLVIVEQLSTIEEWEAIRMYLPDSKNGSRIAVATQQLGLALSCTRNPYQVSELRQFSYGQSLCAFFNKKGYSDQNRSPATSSRMVEARDWISKLELIGRQYEESDLRHRVLWDGKVTSVWGVAGVGKSVLVRSIYYDDMIECHQLKKYSWVDVPRTFNLTDFSRRLLLDFHSADLEAKETAVIDMMEGQDPIQLCREFLQQGKCLVVIDGLCSKVDWDLIKAAFLAKPIQGHILVITNEESIALHCVDEKYHVFNVKGLEDEAALNLFTKIASGSVKLTFHEVELSRRIMTKCGGLPKVITAVAEYNCSYSSKRMSLERTYDDFMSLLEISPEFSSLRSLFSWMQSYFNDCPDSLKPCIFYFSIFPSGHHIRRRRLLRRWIAEGYSTEENGEKLLSDLVKLSIIQQLSPRKADVCQFNGFFREYIISRPMQDNLVFSLEGHCSLNSQHAGQHLTISTSWDRAKILFESMELSRLRSFTVFGEWRSFFISVDANMKLLRVLDLEDTSGVTDGDLEPIGKLIPRLKFLSLRGCKDLTCLPSSLGGLRQLQTLDIKGTSIVTLPPAIMKLEKLQYVRAGTTSRRSTPSEDDNGIAVGGVTPAPAGGDGGSTSQPPAAASAVATPPARDADGTSTSQPPPDAAANEARTSTPWSSRPLGDLAFSWLSKFRRNGLVSSAHDGVQFPAAATRGIGKLRALHTLGVINVEGESGKVVLREMKKLAQLRKLKLFGINRKNWQDFCFAISGHGYLESLSVRLDDEQHDHVNCLDDISKPPKTLKSLKLYGGNVHVSQVWMKQLDGLTKAHLEAVELTVSTQEEIDGLMELPCHDMYHRLCVKPIQDGELRYGRWANNWDGELFRAAKILKIDCGSYRSEIVFGDWIPNFVEVLVVHCSTTEASLKLSGLDELWSLKEVWLKGAYSEAVKQHLQDEVDSYLSNLNRWAPGRRTEGPVLKLGDQPSSS